MKICVLLLVFVTAFASGQRITTIQLDGVQYFVSRMNPYSPELNYFLAYQYCRSLGLQLASFETKEKADTMTQYLQNAGYTKYDFWTSGNKLGTDMYLWMSTGLPFNGTFNYMVRRSGNRAADVPPGTEPQRVARESGDSGSADGCVAMVAPSLSWDAQDCTLIKDFICEQTRCYYYNYGSIPVSATQGNRRPYLTTTASPDNDIDGDNATTNKENVNTPEEASVAEEQKEAEEEEAVEEEVAAEGAEDEVSNVESQHSDDNDLENDETGNKEGGSYDNERVPEDPVVGRLMTTAGTSGITSDIAAELSTINDKDETVDNDNNNNNDHNDGDNDENDNEKKEAEKAKDREVSLEAAKATRPVDIPDITSLFINGAIGQSRKETVFDGLETHEIRSSSRSNIRGKLEHRENQDGGEIIASSVGNAESDLPAVGNEEGHTIGPYDSVQEDYVNDQPQEDTAAVSSSSSSSSSFATGSSGISAVKNKEQQEQQDEDSSTFLPEAEPEYRYNMKWRSMGKVLDPPSK